jgi:hypothetical protein
LNTRASSFSVLGLQRAGLAPLRGGAFGHPDLAGDLSPREQRVAFLQVSDPGCPAFVLRHAQQDGMGASVSPQ